MKVKSWFEKGAGILKKALSFLKSPNILVVFFIVLLFTSGFLIYALNKTVTPSFYLDQASFKSSDVGRSIELYVKVREGDVELSQFFVDDNPVGWIADKPIIHEGESSHCTLKFRWKAGEHYTIKVVTTDGKSADFIVQAPLITPIFRLELRNVKATVKNERIEVEANYWVLSNGTDSTHVLLFTYLYFNPSKRPVYIFYDPNYMPTEGLRRAETIISLFKIYNISIEKADYNALQEFSRKKPKIILILINPLKDYKGKLLKDAAPASLLDLNENGLIRDDSKYGKSLLYDWMKDDGLIFVTIGSLQPYKRLVYSSGAYSYTKDSKEPFDAHFFLTDASGERSIINGSWVLGNYTPTRVSCSLGIAFREAAFGFDKDSMEKYGLQYYAYGDYNLPFKGTVLNLTLPVFIRVGSGGWLALEDGENWLDNEELAHDLLMMFLHEVWDSIWVPYGWYWDNGAIFYANYNVISLNGSAETEFMPLKILTNKLFIRLVGVAYSSDVGSGTLLEQKAIYDNS